MTPMMPGSPAATCSPTAIAGFHLLGVPDLPTR
jgi:hypothetical protein